MIQMQIIKSCIGFLGLTISFTTFANCPLSSEIQVQADNSHFAKTSEGLWSQIEDNQAYKSRNGVLEHPIYEFYVIAASHSHLDVYQKMICIYYINNRNFIKLKSPINNKYKLSTENNNWTNLVSELGKTAGCFSNHRIESFKQDCFFQLIPESIYFV